MRIHQDWSTAAFELPPVAERTGPFPGRDLLEVWWQHRGAKRGRLLLAESEHALMPMYLDERGLMFLGEEHLIDYHSPLGTSVSEVVAESVTSFPRGTPFRFDSMPEAAAVEVRKGLELISVDAEPAEHEVAAVLPLPASFDDYLANIGKKERHELRRKRRRFEGMLGAPRLELAEGREAVARFADMHRRASGEKGEFMSHVMAALFEALHRRAGGVLHFLYGDDPAPVAAAFGFLDESGYYLYNSAYEPQASEASPGIVLLGMLVERAIELRLEVFDFLKGDEDYKFRHGAQRRPLYVLEGICP